MAIRGLLLCGGASIRFGGDKLLATVRAGSQAGRTEAPVAALAARALRAAVARPLAVIRPGQARLRALLESEGCDVLETDRARSGIGASLSAGVEASADADGWLVLLGDLPHVRPETVAAVASRLAAGAPIVAPVHAATGERGHPVGFSAGFREALLALSGDEGARSLISRHRERLVTLPVEDPGILKDIDTPADLA